MTDTIELDIANDTWDELARLNGISAAEAEARYLDALKVADIAGDGAIMLAPPTAEGVCTSQKFEANVWKIIGLNGVLKACGPQSDWTISADINWTVAGMTITKRHLQLGRNRTEVRDTINAGLLRASYGMGVKSSKFCVFVNGSFSYFDFTGWHEHGAEKTLFCFGSIG